ncbi:SIMPL domain-containing protein [Alkalinema sp. FACHB-956]|nr:SIMPL domain-containing protein [Alkalinema sp. FACHB-956]MBD2327717.1 SIMPL domain-containing protein [Alkalinema sp. FACHB-956]
MLSNAARKLSQPVSPSQSSLQSSSATRSRSRYWAILPILLGIMACSVAQPAIAAEKLLRTLTVTGRGTERIPTTLTQVRLGVEAQGKTAKEVQAEVARRATAVVELLKARNVEKLETTGINLSPNYDYRDGKQILVGYVASNMVSFRIPTAKAGTIMDDAVKSGASRIDGVSFIATDAAIADAQKVALRKATQDAQTQANAVLSSLNLTSKEIVSIQVNGATPPTPRLYAADNFKLRAEAASTPVMDSEQPVEASVTLEISY